MTGVLTPPAVEEPRVAAEARGNVATTTGRPPRRLAPTLEEAIDLAGLGGLTALGLFGFGTAYGGSRYFLVGIVGAALGLVVGHVTARTRQPVVVVAAAATLAFFVVGGAAAVPEKALGGILPTPAVVLALVDGAIQGWAKLLTTVPPVGGTDNLLTVPYLCGLVAALLAHATARRTRFPLAAVLFPTIVLALSILFGTEEPASLFLQGAVFGAAALGWASVRRRANRIVGMQTSRRRRWTGVLLSLALIGAGSTMLGERLPGADSNERLVLRKQIEPPFDPRDFPSPLASFRRYREPVQAQGLRDTAMFQVEGLPADVPVRIATMDTYDGVVYSVGSGSDSSGFFQKVGDRLPDRGPGRRVRIRVTVDGYRGVWVPTVGRLEAITFHGDRATELRESFLYNLATDTGVVPIGLRGGDSYTAEVVIPPAEPSGYRRAKSGTAVPSVAVIERLSERAGLVTESATSATETVEAIAATLTGAGYYFSDGQIQLQQAPSRPGHGANRLNEFSDPTQVVPVGNEEQYAAVAALMANATGVPTRVVMGFTASDDRNTTIDGVQVSAWIEYQLDAVGWVPVYDVTPEDREPPPENLTPPPPPQSSFPPPPPKLSAEDDSEVAPNNVKCRTAKGSGGAAKATAASSKDCKPPSCKETPEAERCQGWGVPAWVSTAATFTLPPIGVVALFTGIVGGVKARRRKRRRTTGPHSGRIVGGWREVTDLACDLGSPVPTTATRREAAGLIGTPLAPHVAAEADAAVFGGDALGDSHVEAFWHQVEAARSELVADLSRFGRWKVLVSLSSLRLSAAQRRATS